MSPFTPRLHEPSRLGWVLVVLALSMALSGCQRQNPKLVVFSAASLAGVVEEICREQQLEVSVHQAGSYTLLRQLQQGAQADLVVFADPQAFAELPGAPQSHPVTGNGLVVVASAKANTAVQPDYRAALATARGLLAVADPHSAPLGRYTAQALDGVNLASLKQVPLKNAQSVLAAVATGHADLAIVYRSDAAQVDGLRTICSIPASAHDPIIYSALLLNQERPSGEELLRSLLSGRGQQRLSERGFQSL